MARKNDGGIELHLSKEERILFYKALRHYHAYHEPPEEVLEDTEKICMILNTLDMEEAT